jgi:hypothetical protein
VLKKEVKALQNNFNKGTVRQAGKLKGRKTDRKVVH